VEYVFSLSVAALLALLAAQNVSLRRELRQAREAAKAQGEFLAMMSHEIRTPVNGVLGMAQILLGSRIDGEARECIQTIHDATDGLLTLLNDVLDLSRVEAGKLEIETVFFSPRDTASMVASLLRPAAEAKGITLTLRIDPATPSVVLGDPARVRQVLLNLAGNSAKFTARGGVEIAIAPARAGEVRIDVRDTGIGIAPDRLKSLFQRYYQAESSHARKFGGTGLGLSITRELVALMKGSLAVESQPGRGSMFSVTLPLPEAPAAAVPVLAERVPPLASYRGRALVVDDNRVNLRVAEKLLASLGLAVTAAGCGSEAAKALAENDFDVVFMDCKMPEVDGFETTKRLRASGGRNARVPVIALTAAVFDEDRDHAVSSGMDDFLAKPVRLEMLRQSLDRWLPAGPVRKPVAEQAIPMTTAP
jgi:CheY-like chemotaxis protein